jgi:hypothetical protein
VCKDFTCSLPISTVDELEKNISWMQVNSIYKYLKW